MARRRPTAGDIFSPAGVGFQHEGFQERVGSLKVYSRGGQMGRPTGGTPSEATINQKIKIENIKARNHARGSELTYKAFLKCYAGSWHMDRTEYAAAQEW